MKIPEFFLAKIEHFLFEFYLYARMTKGTNKGGPATNQMHD